MLYKSVLSVKSVVVFVLHEYTKKEKREKRKEIFRVENCHPDLNPWNPFVIRAMAV